MQQEHSMISEQFAQYPWRRKNTALCHAGYMDAVSLVYADCAAKAAPRMQSLKNRFGGSLWADRQHQMRFEQVLYQLGAYQLRAYSFFAALYLLTADEEIFHRCYNAFFAHGIDFHYIRIAHISLQRYALVQAARDLYQNTDLLQMEDLFDSRQIDEHSFALITNAILICLLGPDALKITSI